MSWDPGKWCSHRGKQETLRLMRGFSTAVMVSGRMVALQKGRPTYWNKAPATNDGSKQLTTADVDVLGADRHEVVGRAYRVGRDVDTEGDDNQADSAKSGSSTATVGPGFHPQADDYDGVPDNLAICRLSSCGSEDAKQSNNSCRSR
jgi:hypothetical protein